MKSLMGLLRHGPLVSRGTPKCKRKQLIKRQRLVFKWQFPTVFSFSHSLLISETQASLGSKMSPLICLMKSIWGFCSRACHGKHGATLKMLLLEFTLKV